MLCGILDCIIIKINQNKMGKKFLPVTVKDSIQKIYLEDLVRIYKKSAKISKPIPPFSIGVL